MSKKHREFVEREVEQVIENEEVVEETIVVEPVKSAKAYGVVCNCGMLNIRKEMSSTANVVDIIGKGTKVEIELTESTDKWYKICTSAGSEGYAMIDYIEIVE